MIDCLKMRGPTRRTQGRASAASDGSKRQLRDKVLNKAQDYDARILDPLSFMDVAMRLDQVVLSTAVGVIGVEGSSLELPTSAACG